MTSSTTWFRSFVLFLILIFAFYLVPHLEMSFQYGFHFLFNEARAEEIQSKDISSEEKVQEEKALVASGTSALSGASGRSGASLFGGASGHSGLSGTSLRGGANEHRVPNGTSAPGGASKTN